MGQLSTQLIAYTVLSEVRRITGICAINDPVISSTHLTMRLQLIISRHGLPALRLAIPKGFPRL